MKPDGGSIPHEGMLADAINKDFGSYDKFVAEMETAALTTFGSGWAWLGYDGKKQKLVVTKTTGEYLKEYYLEISAFKRFADKLISHDIIISTTLAQYRCW